MCSSTVKRILISTTVVILLSMVLTACEKIPDPSVDTELAAVLNNEGDLNIVSEEGQPLTSLAEGETSSKILDSISYTVISTKADGHTATSVVEFETPDVVALAEQFFLAQPENADFNSWLSDQLDGAYPTIEKEVTLEMVYQDEAWSLVATDDFYNVLTGGALDYYIEQQRSAYDGWKEAVENETDH